MKKKVATFLLSSLLAGSAIAAEAVDTSIPKSKRSAAEVWSADGLQQVSAKGLDVVYSRPGTSLATYNKVLLRPISVSFRRGWEKTPLPGTHIRIPAADIQRIKDRLAMLVSEELVKELAKGGYTLSPTSGDDVLEVTMSITDLYISAPDVPSASRTSVYAVSAGEMTLVAELKDSSSGETAMRIYDHAEAHESSRPVRITSVDNATEARAVASAWAVALRNQLDVAKGINVKK